MKRVLFLMMLVIGFISCGDDSPKKKEDPIIKVHAFYTTNEAPELQVPDAQSKVYIYYNHNVIDFIGYSIQSNGLLVNGESTIRPDQSAQIDSEGNATIIPTNTDAKKPVAIIIESNHYKKHKRYGHASIRGIDYTAVFTYDD